MATTPPAKIRSAVFRSRAQTYLLISVVSFACTVVFTRLFLELTGYPQIGGEVLHIAHVLWGGLLLFAAVLLLLLLANRWALHLGALLSGIGVGLFIDEVGKFITTSNDYFFPAAAPIIYAFFLLVVMLYLRVRRRPAADSRQQLYQVLENMTEILDHDLETHEREAIVQQLQYVESDGENPSLAQLSRSLLVYLEASDVPVQKQRVKFFDKVRFTIRHIEDHYLTQTRLRILLATGLLACGILAWYEIAPLFPRLRENLTLLEVIISGGLELGQVRSMVGARMYFIHLSVQALLGFALIVSAALLAVGRDRLGVEMGGAFIVLTLTTFNLLTFFVDQFSAAVIAIFQLFVLLGLSAYRRRFLHDPDQEASPKASP